MVRPEWPNIGKVNRPYGRKYEFDCHANYKLIAGDMMKKVIFMGLILMASMTALAQEAIMDDGSRVVLPLDVQACNLPSAPPPIPDPPIKEELLKAQKLVKQFQAELLVYRTCMGVETEEKLEGLKDREGLSMGNKEAIYKAYDYSVSMETRVAEMFNEALQASKAGLANQ